MTHHTPGPWNVWNTFRIANNNADVKPPEDIATVESGNIADARLIAAAPDLLDACIRAEWWLSTVEDSDAIRTIVQLAISKAKGQTS